MNRSDTWKTWALVAGLLIFTGLASVAFLWLSSQEPEAKPQIAPVERETQPITISIGDYVLGDELLGIPFISENIEGSQLNPWIAVAGLFIILTLLVGGMGTILALLSWIGSPRWRRSMLTKDFRRQSPP